MQRDDLIYDMYKRRIESGLSYGHGYSGGVPSGGARSGGASSGGSYHTGDGLLADPMYPIGMHMTDRRFVPQPIPYHGSGANAWTNFVKAHKGSGKDIKQLAKLWKKHKEGKKKHKKTEYQKFMKKAKKDNPNMAYRDLDCLWFKSQNKHSKNPKTRARCGFDEKPKFATYEQFKRYILASVDPEPTEEDIQEWYQNYLNEEQINKNETKWSKAEFKKNIPAKKNTSAKKPNIYDIVDMIVKQNIKPDFKKVRDDIHWK